MRKFIALFNARNKEYLRDRATLGWNFIFPLVVIFGFAVIFSGTGRDLYKVALIEAPGGNGASSGARSGNIGPRPGASFLETEYVEFIPVTNAELALEKVRRHQYDMVLDLNGRPRYWINGSNPKGYFLERVLWGSGAEEAVFHKEVLEGREIRYIDWVLPGVLAMNMMFSCLFGVGYVIVRYRKGGILRRLKVAPITAFEFMAAQVASRLILVLIVTTLIYVGTDLVLDFYRLGSLLDLAVVFAVGAMSLISLGLLVSARTHSQELAGGLLNLASWPMMLLSGVWFSMEGSDPWLLAVAQLLPLTHLTDAARKIMLDGMGLIDVWPQISVLAAMTLVFLAVGAYLFRWE